MTLKLKLLVLLKSLNDVHLSKESSLSAGTNKWECCSSYGGSVQLHNDLKQALWGPANPVMPAGSISLAQVTNVWKWFTDCLVSRGVAWCLEISRQNRIVSAMFDHFDILHFQVFLPQCCPWKCYSPVLSGDYFMIPSSAELGMLWRHFVNVFITSLSQNCPNINLSQAKTHFWGPHTAWNDDADGQMSAKSEPNKTDLATNLSHSSFLFWWAGSEPDLGRSGKQKWAAKVPSFDTVCGLDEHVWHNVAVLDAEKQKSILFPVNFWCWIRSLIEPEEHS